MSSKNGKNGQFYTIGYNYKCGNCGMCCRNFKEERGMNMWKRLHFKKNPDCKKHHKKFGLGDGFNDSFTDMEGRKHNVSSARGETNGYKMPKMAGHNKETKRLEKEDMKRRKDYKEKAKTDKFYQKQLVKDAFDKNIVLTIGSDDRAVCQKDIDEMMNEE